MYSLLSLYANTRAVTTEEKENAVNLGWDSSKIPL